MPGDAHGYLLVNVAPELKRRSIGRQHRSGNANLPCQPGNRPLLVRYWSTRFSVRHEPAYQCAQSPAALVRPLPQFGGRLYYLVGGLQMREIYHVDTAPLLATAM